MNISVLCNKEEQFKAALKYECVSEIIVEADRFKKHNDVIERCKAHGRKIGIAFPYICRKEKEGEGEPDIDTKGFDFALVRSLGELSSISEGTEIHSDFNLYAMNTISCRMLKELGISRITAPVELNEYELSEIDMSDKELIVYGHYVMMVSAQCINRNTGRCDRKEKVLFLEDRTGRKMPVENRCDYCYNLIYNAVPTSLIGISGKVIKLNPQSIRVNLSIENADETMRILDAVKTAFAERRFTDDPVKEYTRGHFNRGVE